MPHSTQDQDDEDLIRSFLAGNQDENVLSTAVEDRDLEIGEKADDAEDFEDIGDDDLADDEGESSTAHKLPDLNGDTEVKDEEDDEDLFGDDGGNLDDLFGPAADHPSSSSTLPDASGETVRPSTEILSGADGFSFGSTTAEDVSFQSRDRDSQPKPSVVDEEDEDPAVAAQRKLFDLSRRHQDELAGKGIDASEPPPPPETDAELFSIVWPQFEPNVPPRMGTILTSKKAYYATKTPLKPPKPVQPTKIHLEIAPDQEKSFRLPGAATPSFAARLAEAEAKGMTLTAQHEVVENSSEDELMEHDNDSLEDVGGVSWQDLVALCEDWQIPDGMSSSGEEEDDDDDAVGRAFNAVDKLFTDNQGWTGTPHPRKKRKLEHLHGDPFSLSVHSLSMAALDDPERATMKLAKKVNLDLDDPNLLIDVQQPNQTSSRRRKFGTAFKRDATGGLTRDFNRKYNISNDEAYELLKENHQSKIRSHLSNVSIEHSMPAVRLQYPFYKVKLTAREARYYHRPLLSVTLGPAWFSKLNIVKKKDRAKKDALTMYPTTADLSLGDNSNLLLLEYSEEHPAMLSNFGMNSRVINYYRKTDEHDTTRPKLPIGDPMVLLSQDKSPFSIFGDVEPGRVTPTIRNNMYRAPIFAHEGKPQDFLVVRTKNAADGALFYIRNIENLHTVGQEFPLVEVPGPHSRKVTDASKKRLKMLAFRTFSKNKRVTNELILKHIGGDIATNRSKMRDIMEYDKEGSKWVPKKDGIPDEATIRAFISPEEIALLDAMQVGDRHLQDAGYNKAGDGDEDDDEEKEGQSLHEKLVPWHTTKNFLHACQGKAMLQLYGEGDPTGRGEGFSMIRTSMKGGFREQGQSIEDRLKKENGHSYNVAKQQQAYNNAIKRIWEKQKVSLSSNTELEAEGDVDDYVEAGAASRGQTPSMTPGKIRRDDESMFSRASDTSQPNRGIMITRTFIDQYGKPVTKQIVEHDSKVIREYQRRRRAIELSSKSIADLKATGDPEADREAQRLLQQELARVERNVDRRKAREKAKGINTDAGSPDGNSPAADGTAPSKKNTTGTTQRKCANCGQVGHIKTNKKYCNLCEYLNAPVSLSVPGFLADPRLKERLR